MAKQSRRPLVFFGLTVAPFTPDEPAPEIPDLLRRIDALLAAGGDVLLFRKPELYHVTGLVNRHTQAPVRFVAGLSLLIRASGALSSELRRELPCGFANIACRNQGRAVRRLSGLLGAKTAATISNAVTQAFVFGFRLVMLLRGGLAVASAGVALRMIPSRGAERLPDFGRVAAMNVTSVASHSGRQFSPLWSVT